VLVGEAFAPLAARYVPILGHSGLYWANTISAAMDNATLVALEIHAMDPARAREAVIALLVAGGFLVLGAWAGTLRSLFGAGSVYLHAFGYGIWSLEQEFILNSFFYLLLEKLLGNNHRTALCAALLFSFAHIPNPILVPATLVGGMLFVEAFRKWRNIYPLGFAHAMLGLSLALTVSDSWMHHMRVGLSFLRFHMNG